jgi:hypothetical protein
MTILLLRGIHEATSQNFTLESSWQWSKEE